MSSHDRRSFVKQSLATAAVVGAAPAIAAAEEKEKKKNRRDKAESMVKVLFDSLTPGQREKVCYDWDHQDPKLGLLRTRVAANWQMNPQEIYGDFYTAEQQDIIRKVFEGIVHPQWISKFDQQLEDDCGGFGREQALGIFGNPNDGKFEFVLTGRHMTLRCDGNSEDHVAFGGPIFYGHAPSGEEEADHPGNVFWDQAVSANKVYEMLDGKQRKAAQFAKTPREQAVAFQGNDGKFTGIPVTDLANDQKGELQKTLQSLVAPFRQVDRREAMKHLKKQGGLDACYLTFYTDADIGKDEVWDNWRLEGPSFVWHYRGAPHVHVWVNIADPAEVKLNA